MQNETVRLTEGGVRANSGLAPDPGMWQRCRTSDMAGWHPMIDVTVPRYHVRLSAIALVWAAGTMAAAPPARSDTSKPLPLRQLSIDGFRLGPLPKAALPKDFKRRPDVKNKAGRSVAQVWAREFKQDDRMGVLELRVVRTRSGGRVYLIRRVQTDVRLAPYLDFVKAMRARIGKERTRQDLEAGFSHVTFYRWWTASPKEPSRRLVAYTIAWNRIKSPGAWVGTLSQTLVDTIVQARLKGNAK